MTTPDIPTEALEAAARAIAARAHSKRHGQLCPCWTKGAPIGECNCWILTRARGDAAAAAPHLIAEGRRQAVVKLLAYADNYPESVFRSDGDSRDAIAGTAMRHAYRNAAVIVSEIDDV